jgi:hypothetical protein
MIRPSERNLEIAASKTGMSENTARKYLKAGQLPSQTRQARTYRTRADAFAEDWATIEVYVKDPKVQAKTVWAFLKRLRPGKYQEGQLRALQRRIKQWRALYGVGKEVFFPQEHHPGDLCASDFVHMGDLGITVGRIPYDHLLYHFVLTYSNWETGSTCQSESFESLSAGLQNALWELGGAAARHRTDRLTAAVRALGRPAEEFTRRYQGLLAHYRMRPEAIQAGKANENGDVEQRHYRFKQAVEQALLMRGSRDFADLEAYRAFLRTVTDELNAGRKTRFEEERSRLQPLPRRRLEDWTRMTVPVSSASTIQVQNNTYSIHNRLIGAKVEVRLHIEHLEIWYAGKCVDRMARLRGRQGHRINYRHVIDWLVRKPGAFAQYRYRDALFPTSRFRQTFDRLKRKDPARGHKEYLKILQMAAMESESGVDTVLRHLLSQNQVPDAGTVFDLLVAGAAIPPVTDVTVAEVDLTEYDALVGAGTVDA